MKSKSTAALLAILLGGVGAHKFYLNRTGQGMLYLLFCLTGIPMVIGIIEGIVYLLMSDAEFDLKYNTPYQYMGQQQQQNVVINMVAPTVPATAPTIEEAKS